MRELMARVSGVLRRASRELRETAVYSTAALEIYPDSMRIVHHSNYLVYFEEARSDYMRQRGENYANFERGGFNLAVTEVNVRYLRAAVYALVGAIAEGTTFIRQVADGDELTYHVTTGLLPGDDHVDVLLAAQAVVGDRQQRVRVRWQVHADHV